MVSWHGRYCITSIQSTKHGCCQGGRQVHQRMHPRGPQGTMSQGSHQGYGWCWDPGENGKSSTLFIPTWFVRGAFVVASLLHLLATSCYEVMSVTQDLRFSYFLPTSRYYSPNSIKELTLQASNHEITVIGKHCLHSGHVSEGLTLILNSAARSSCLGAGGLRDAEPAESPPRRYT